MLHLTIITYTMSILSHLLRFLTPSLSPTANPVKPIARIKEAIREATGTRDRQIQQHLLQEVQHAEDSDRIIMNLEYQKIIRVAFEQLQVPFRRRMKGNGPRVIMPEDTGLQHLES